jgi:hypothetical protein
MLLQKIRIPKETPPSIAVIIFYIRLHYTRLNCYLLLEKYLGSSVRVAPNQLPERCRIRNGESLLAEGRKGGMKFLPQCKGMACLNPHAPMPCSWPPPPLHTAQPSCTATICCTPTGPTSPATPSDRPQRKQKETGNYLCLGKLSSWLCRCCGSESCAFRAL